MVDRFEIEVDTTAANQKWQVEVEENLAAQSRESDQSEKQEVAEQPAT
jgi:3-ketosteroid 9alpha-monooxygenase subunit A